MTGTMARMRQKWTHGAPLAGVALLGVALLALALPGCFPKKGGNGKKGQNHQLLLTAIYPDSGSEFGGTGVLSSLVCQWHSPRGSCGYCIRQTGCRHDNRNSVA